MKTVIVNNNIYKLPDIDAMQLEFLFEAYHEIENKSDQTEKERKKVITIKERIYAITDQKKSTRIDDHYQF